MIYTDNFSENQEELHYLSQVAALREKKRKTTLSCQIDVDAKIKLETLSVWLDKAQATIVEEAIREYYMKNLKVRAE